MAKNKIGFRYNEGEEEENSLPQEEDLTNIGAAAKSIFQPADTFGSSDVELNNESMKERLENLMGTTFSIADMVQQLKNNGFKQLAAGGDMFWLLKKK